MLWSGCRLSSSRGTASTRPLHISAASVRGLYHLFGLYMNKRTRIVVIVLVVGLLAMALPSLLWYVKQGETQDAGLQKEAQKMQQEQAKP